MIRSALFSDAARLAEIYNHYVLTTTVSFEEHAVTSGEMATRVETTLKSGAWLVYEDAGRILGYAYFTPWRARSAYRFSAECTVYVDKDSRRSGIGRKLYTELIQISKTRGLHRLIAGIALPNPASQALHTHLGFQKVAHFSEVGYKQGSWVDVGYWELTL